MKLTNLIVLLLNIAIGKGFCAELSNQAHKTAALIIQQHQQTILDLQDAKLCTTIVHLLNAVNNIDQKTRGYLYALLKNSPYNNNVQIPSEKESLQIFARGYIQGHEYLQKKIINHNILLIDCINELVALDYALRNTITNKSFSAATLQSLIKQGADINARDCTGKTALLIAITTHEDNSKIGHELLLNDADPNIPDYNGQTPLHFAGNKDITLSLLKKGANPNARNKFGQTPLHMAAYWNNPEIVYELLKASANPNAQDASGNTPLHALANQSSNDTSALQVSMLLLQAKADKTIKNTYKMTAADKASFWNLQKTYSRLSN